jgi:Tol biopolymer transport system component/imidazolonepropionase-like amidohydrolase
VRSQGKKELRRVDAASVHSAYLARSRSLARRAAPGAIRLLVASALLANCGLQDVHASPRVDRGDDVLGVFGEQGTEASQAFMTPKGKVRTIDFTTDQGTFISVDVSPDGKSVIFDLCGHIYRMGRNGGAAISLTAGSGIALNYQPRFSPDGTRIVFVSDRSGQANVWVMTADGQHPRLVYADPDSRYYQPVWAADGQSIYVVKGVPSPGRAWERRSSSIWRIPVAGGVAVPILVGTLEQHYAPALSADGMTLYFERAIMAARGIAFQQTEFRIQALNLISGEVKEITSKPKNHTVEGSDGDYWRPIRNVNAEFEPIPSGDGRYLAFGRAENEAITIRGHSYPRSTALFVRDLRSGTVRRVFSPITNDLTDAITYFTDQTLPSYAWDPDNRHIVISANGRLIRIDVESGRAQPIPFRVHVHRVISQQVRAEIRADADNAVRSRFLRWPASSPDGRFIAFVGIGRVWIQELGTQNVRAIAGEPPNDVQLTPAFSPDGSSAVFASWNDLDRGSVWLADLRTGELRKLTRGPGEFIYPIWAPDGRHITVLKRSETPLSGGSPPLSPEDYWDSAGNEWEAVTLELNGSESRRISVGRLVPITYSQDGRLLFERQRDPKAAADLAFPYPSDASLQQRWMAASADPNGIVRDVLAFPPRERGAVMPAISPDGKWVAYQADFRIFVEPVGIAGDQNRPREINPDPNVQRSDRQRVDERGGIDFHWRDAQTLEFMSGNDYVRVNVVTGERQVTPVMLTYPRDLAHGTVAFVHARIIPIEGKQVLENSTLIVRDGRIDCVGTCVLENANSVIDATGKTIIPGLIDVHSHTTNANSQVVPLRRPRSILPLAYGVTTIVDPASRPELVFPLAEMTEAGRVRGPRVLTTADIVASSVGGPNATSATADPFADAVNLSSREDAEYEIERRVAWGAVSIKNFRQTRRLQQQWLIEAARRHGVSVTAEGGSVLSDLGFAMDGQTGWEHFIAAVPLYRDVSEFLGQAHMTYSPTLSVAGVPEGAMFYWRANSNLMRDAKYRGLASETELRASRSYMNGEAPRSKESFAFPVLSAGVADVIHAGGYAAIGDHGEQPGIGSQWEIFTYSSALTPMEALTVATIDGARFVGFEQQIGSLRPGKFADFVVLNSNPLDDIKNTADIQYVVRNGHVYEGNTLDAVWPRKDRFGPLPWVAQ